MISKEVKEQIRLVQIGEELIFETEKELFVGKLQYIDVNNKFVRIRDVQDVKNNVTYTTVYMLPLERVKCIKTLRQDETTNSSDVDCKQAKSLQSSSEESDSSNTSVGTTVTGNNSKLKKMELTPFELQLLQKQINSVKVIISRGAEYNDAIADIKSRSCVSLHVLPYRNGRNRKLSIITIATENSIYLFDILFMGSIYEEIKSILRAERPCKTLFNSRLVADHFQHRHNLYLNGISDTFVSYCIVTKQKLNLELEDVFSQYFGISKEFFKHKVVNDTHIVFSRPLEESLISNCAKKAAFLLKLEDHLKKEMLKKYYSQCLNFSRTYADNEDSSEVANSIEIKDDSGLQYIKELDLNDQSL